MSGTTVINATKQICVTIEEFDDLKTEVVMEIAKKCAAQIGVEHYELIVDAGLVEITMEGDCEIRSWESNPGYDSGGWPAGEEEDTVIDDDLIEVTMTAMLNEALGNNYAISVSEPQYN